MECHEIYVNYSASLQTIQLLNTFTAIVDLHRFNNSCLKWPVSRLVNLIYQSCSFSFNQLYDLSLLVGNLYSSFSISSWHYLIHSLLCLHCDIMNPCLSLCLEGGRVGCLWLQYIKNLLYVKSCMCDSLYFSLQHGI